MSLCGSHMVNVCNVFYAAICLSAFDSLLSDFYLVSAFFTLVCMIPHSYPLNTHKHTELVCRHTWPLNFSQLLSPFSLFIISSPFPHHVKMLIFHLLICESSLNLLTWLWPHGLIVFHKYLKGA